LEGLRTGADEYIVKPFNIGILKATIANLLVNRAILRRKYGNPDTIIGEGDEENNLINYSNNIDWKFITDVKKNIENKMDDPMFNVDVLCAMLNMSRTSFYNKIKALTDHAPADYVRIIRLNKAAQLLKEGNYNVTEIAEMTGFNDAKYFREVFKKHFNVSPSKYKESSSG
ncbi:Sensor histidine kinase TodS, partial [termite gut metagenome]